MKERAKEMLVAGAAELGITLTSAELVKLSSLTTELKKWSNKINITSIKDDEGIAVKHILDSLTLLKVVAGKGRMLDIGSGGGFPAIPLKIVRSDVHVVSVDAVGKKIIFQRHAARLLRIHDFEAVHARAEELTARYPESFDWIVSRAFSDLPTFVRIAIPLLRKGGEIIAMKGSGGREETESSRSQLNEMGAEVKEIIEFRLPITGDARALVIINGP